MFQITDIGFQSSWIHGNQSIQIIARAIEDKGDIQIFVGKIHIEGTIKGAISDLGPGDYVLLSVIDTGCGMDAETQSKAFDPYFTSKMDGTGLGLYVCHTLVEGLRGRIEVRSEPSRGSSFREASTAPGTARSG